MSDKKEIKVGDLVRVIKTGMTGMFEVVSVDGDNYEVVQKEGTWTFKLKVKSNEITKWLKGGSITKGIKMNQSVFVVGEWFHLRNNISKIIGNVFVRIVLGKHSPQQAIGLDFGNRKKDQQIWIISLYVSKILRSFIYDF